MANTIGIRPVQLEDLGLLKQLAEQTFIETFAHDNSPEQLEDFFHQAYSEPVLKAELENPETKIDFLIYHDQVVGFLKLNWGQAQTEQILDRAFEIQRLYILKEYQGKGLGRFLMDYAMKMAQESGNNWVWLGVWEHNHKAQALYKAYGFERFGQHDFPVGDKIDTDWLLRKALK